jgi:hypothetical protein
MKTEVVSIEVKAYRTGPVVVFERLPLSHGPAYRMPRAYPQGQPTVTAASLRRVQKIHADWLPDPLAVQEAQALYTAALEAEGQGTLDNPAVIAVVEELMDWIEDANCEETGR